VAAVTAVQFYRRAAPFPDSPWHALVLRQIDEFLTSLGYLKGDATVGVPANSAAALRKESL